MRTTTTSLRNCGPAARARTDSSSADTPAASSAAPGPVSTESWCAMRNSRPVGSLPGSTATTLWTRAISVEPGSYCQAPTEFCTRVSRPRPVRVSTSPSTTRSPAALPATCVSAAICCTCSNARPALNSSAGASTGARCGRLQRGDAPRRPGRGAGRPGSGRERRVDGGVRRLRRFGNARQPRRHPRWWGSRLLRRSVRACSASWSATAPPRRRSSRGGTGWPTAARSPPRRRTGRRARPR